MRLMNWVGFMKIIPTEIYSRVVGYYRPVGQWNKGKQAEFEERKESICDTRKSGKSTNDKIDIIVNSVQEIEKEVKELNKN